jgi:antitoxin component of MazEF toxin-antitoxin module
VTTIYRKTDRHARLRLPADFASCVVTIEHCGDELRIRKQRRRYTFRELMAGVTPRNIHREVRTGRSIGRESL